MVFPLKEPLIFLNLILDLLVAIQKLITVGINSY